MSTAEPVTFREILFPTDFSPASAAAGRTAADLARRFGARLHVLHVVPPVTDPSPAPAALGAAVAELGAGLAVVSEVASGFPARKIVEYARRKGIDLIVLGTHGRTGFSLALLGSVAEAVVRRAPCRVLTVPAVPAEAREAAVPAEGEEAAVVGRCLVCAAPSPDLICEPCRVRIRGEALERKRQEERAGRPPGLGAPGRG
jgi:nucleotide-binding universal stress UspA family protein